MPDLTVAPLAVFAEAWPLREALILTFNSNLGFFERAALARLRARGARVTLVSDADMVHADPDAVRFAGRAYLDGRAVCRGGGAFHPKLIVTVSDEQAAVLVGSGNASPGGWVDNAELWTLLRATADSAPGSLRRIAEFLDTLPAHVRFTPGVEPVLTDIATSLRSFTVTEDGPTVVSSVWGPIIDQLPREAATHLIVATPFHDRDGEALRRLQQHFGAHGPEVLVQPSTVFDGPRLAATLEELGGTACTIVDTRYHHGKLVEWRTTRGPVSLSGSANASQAALLFGMSRHGNCELGLVAATQDSLRPATGELAAPSTIADHEWRQPPETGGQADVVLLAAILQPDGLRLVLRRPLTAPATLEHLADNRWIAVGTVPPGVEEHVGETLLPGASAVRVAYQDGTASAVVWVTELARTSSRHVAAKRTLPNDPVALALDPRLITMVETALATVRAWSAVTSAPGTVPLRGQPRRSTDRESWRDYIDGFRSEVGDDFSFFVLPTLMRDAGLDPPVDPGPDGGEGGAGIGGPEVDEILVRLQALQSSDVAIERLKTYRRMCEKLNQASPGRPQPVLIAATTLTVAGGALGCWKDKLEFAKELRWSLRRLAPLADHDELAADAANIAAIALSLLQAQAAKASISGEVGVLYRAATQDVRQLLIHASADGITERAAGLISAVFGRAVSTVRVLATTAAATEPDHLGAAVESLLDRHRLQAAVDGNLIRVTTEVARDPTSIALQVVGLAQAAPSVGVVVHSASMVTWTAWRKPHLVIVQRTGRNRRVTLFTLSGTLSPADHLQQEGRIPTRFEKGNWYGNVPVPEIVEDVLLDADLLLDEL